MRMATAQHVWREAAAAPFRREQVVRMILSDQHDRSATTTSRRGRRWRWPELQPHRPDVLAQERQRVLVGVCPSPGRLPARGPAVVPTENLIRTVRVTDRADVGPANDGNVSIAAVHSVNVDEWLASFGRSSGRRAACTVFRRRPSMAVVRPRDDGSCGAGRPRAASQ